MGDALEAQRRVDGQLEDAAGARRLARVDEDGRGAGGVGVGVGVGVGAGRRLAAAVVDHHVGRAVDRRRLRRHGVRVCDRDGILRLLLGFTLF